LVSLSIPKIESVESHDKYGRFVIEPLDKGFGTTLGNALRRVLLRYLAGAAVTRVRMEGVQHEFSPIPNVKEDTIDFLLNVKSLKLKALTGRPGKLYLEKEGEGEVFASDITPSADFEIVNPDLYLATLSGKKARIAVEMDVDLGMGYQIGGGENTTIGNMLVDAIFTPVRKVNFTTEPMHLGRETSQERLTIEIWTDGTITPARAISRGALILVEQLRPVVDFSRASDLDDEKKSIRAAIPESLYNMPVEKLDLSVRAMNCLRRSGINKVGELASLDEKELLSLRNFGEKSRQEVEEKLSQLGLLFPKAAELVAEKNDVKEQKKSSRKKSTSK